MMVPIILGVIIGVLSSGSGLGGGFLVVPFLLHLGKEVRVAVGTSFLFILMVAISSLFGPVSYTHLTLPTNREV